jgi:hypothetical protein
MPKMTVCGGGNAAHVLIALGNSNGWEVDVFASFGDEADRLAAGIAANDGMTAKFGDRTISGNVRAVSADPAEVIPGSELILIALPAFAHGPTLQDIAPYLDPGTAIGTLPARGGFDFQARAILNIEEKSLRLFGLQTLPWACRIVTYGQEVEVLGTKASVEIGVYPAAHTATLIQTLEPLLGLALHPVAGFLTLSVANTGQLIHPGIMYGVCRGKEEKLFSPDELPLFYQGVDENTATLLQAMSAEVQAVAAAVANRVPGFKPEEVVTLHDWLLTSYPHDIEDKTSLQRSFNTNRAYTGLRVPSRPAGDDKRMIDFKARYLSEDVPYGLVVLRGIAELADVATPTIDDVILWAQSLLGKQYLFLLKLSGVDMVGTRAPQVYGITNLESASLD